ncbi:adenylate kinase [Candidatus Profftia sp. (ex Adelges kitamiensis)]|uniref:adenylate kinase n=1 Tax=Candidatus Profftia sp. (ex Adelges kitamiensis) TaxID=2864218 RepID=UPI001CE3488B|nr:adenylate kinase [Candidatus Profftia sp. (ex Adelges kitamiensis)]
MRIILLAAPGSGKGTQAQFIMERYNIPKISTGDMLRAAVNTNIALNKKSKDILNTGMLVADELVICLVKQRIFQKDCKNGFLLDGFPRTLFQAHSLKAANITIDFVLEFNTPYTLLFERIAGRRVHYGSGRVYHIKFNPPKEEGKDNITGEDLVTRQDDQEDIIRHRLAEYRIQTHPLIGYYKEEAAKGNTKYIKLDGTQSITALHTELGNILG